MIHTFYRLGRLYAASPRLVLLAIVCASAVVGLSLTIPWILKEVLDYGLAQRQIRFLYLAGALLVVVTVVRGVVAYGQSYLTAHLAQHLAYRLRHLLYDHNQRLSFAYHDRAQTGELMSRATADVEAVRMFFQFGWPTGLSVALTGTGTIVAMAYLDWRLAGLTLVSLPFFLGVIVGIGRLLRAVQLRVQEKTAALTVTLQESLTGTVSLCQAGAERLFEILDAVPDIQDAPQARPLPHLQGWVQFEHVSFRYSANVPVLHDITFSAAPGQVIALLGSTGSGKSTIAQLIPRFYDVTSGCITIDGVDIRTYQLAALRRHIGLVMQDTLLFSTTIRDNIAYGREDLDLDTVIAAAKAARAHDFIMQCPDGYDTWVGERGVTLSGGQRQRLAIARAFARNPRLLILDDATSSVDMETEYLIQQALTELMAGRTTFVIAQRLRTLKQADTILVLEDGRIVQCGTHDELVTQPGLYRRTYDLQLRDQEDFWLDATRNGHQRQSHHTSPRGIPQVPAP